MDFENYIFDLYGTLIDVKTDEHAARTWKKWLKILDKEHIKHPDYITFRRDFFKKDAEYRVREKEKTGVDCPEIDILEVYDEMFTNYGNKKLSKEKLMRVSYAFRVSSREYIRLFPGVEDYIRKIHKNNAKAYLLSNAQYSYTYPEIQMFNLDTLLDDILISSDYYVMKPDVRFFDALISKHSMDKSKTIMHGDSRESDIEGAKRAGISYVHLIGENAPNVYYVNQTKGE